MVFGEVVRHSSHGVVWPGGQGGGNEPGRGGKEMLYQIWQFVFTTTLITTLGEGVRARRSCAR